MNEYELMYVLHPRLTEEEINEAIDRISAQVTGSDGEILSVDRWGRRRLAYPIDRNLEGFYVLSTFKAPAEACGPIEAQLNLSEDVLRHLLIRGIIPYDEPPRDERVAPERERPSRSRDDRPPRDDWPPREDAAPAAPEGAPAAAEAAPAEAAPVAEAAPAAEAVAVAEPAAVTEEPAAAAVTEEPAAAAVTEDPAAAAVTEDSAAPAPTEPAVATEEQPAPATSE